MLETWTRSAWMCRSSRHEPSGSGDKSPSSNSNQTVTFGLPIGVTVTVGAPVLVTVALGLAVGEAVFVADAVAVPVCVAVGTPVLVTVALAVTVDVDVAVGDRVAVPVCVAVRAPSYRIIHVCNNTEPIPLAWSISRQGAVNLKCSGLSRNKRGDFFQKHTVPDSRVVTLLVIHREEVIVSDPFPFEEAVLTIHDDENLEVLGGNIAAVFDRTTPVIRLFHIEASRGKVLRLYYLQVGKCACSMRCKRQQDYYYLSHFFSSSILFYRKSPSNFVSKNHLPPLLQRYCIIS